MLLSALCSCAGNHAAFKLHDIVYVHPASRHTEFEIIHAIGNGYYTAWDLRTGAHIEKLAGANLKLVKK